MTRSGIFQAAKSANHTKRTGQAAVCQSPKRARPDHAAPPRDTCSLQKISATQRAGRIDLPARGDERLAHSGQHRLASPLSWIEEQTADSRRRKDGGLEAARLLKRQLTNISIFLRFTVSNTMPEGLNSKIQGIKSNVRGFRSFQNCRILFLLRQTPTAPAIKPEEPKEASKPLLQHLHDRLHTILEILCLRPPGVGERSEIHRERAALEFHSIGIV